MYRLLFLFGLLVTLLGCGTDESTADCTKDADCGDGFSCVAERCLPRAGTLAIVAFAGPTEAVRPGSTATLTWQIDNAQSGQVVVGEEVLHELGSNELVTGSLEVVVTNTTEYKLMASDGTNSVEALVTISVDESPVTIDAFAVAPTAITEGEFATLSWTSQNGTEGRIELEDGTLVVSIDAEELNEGSVRVDPIVSTRYKLIVSNAISSDEKETSVTVTQLLPTIDVFVARQNAIVNGSMTVLEWQVSGAESLAISANGSQIHTTEALTGTLEVAPTEDTIYTLTATSPGGDVTEDVMVAVLAPISIDTFTAAPTSFPLGQTTTLAWTISGDVTSLNLRDSQGNTISVPMEQLADGSAQVSPDITTSYILTASNSAESVEASVDITVLPALPSISSFAANKTLVGFGETVRLTWTTLRATSIAITDDLGNVVDTANTSARGDFVDVVVDRAATYTLTATNAGGDVTADVFVDAGPAVTIDTFSSDVAQIASGESATLTWTTSNATSLTLTAGTQSIDISAKNIAGDSLVLQPTQSTTYRLTATGTTGTATQTLIVIVSTPVALSTFTATPTTVNEGAQVTFAWSGVGVQSAELRCVEDVSGSETLIDIATLNLNSGNTSVVFTESATCTYTADGFRGPAALSASVTVIPTVPRILAFTANADVVATGGTVTLSWETQNADAVTLTDDQGTPIDISALNVAMDSVDVVVAGTTTYTLTATNANGPRTLDLTITAVDAHNLLINEVFYDAAGADSNFEYIELYNVGDSFIDLQYFVVGAGGDTYLETQMPLSGVLAPGGCFVVGGPNSGVENGNPFLDIASAFNASLQNGGVVSDGAAVFFDPAGALGTSTTPNDSVLWEGTNTSNLLGENGTPDTEISPEAAGQSLHRVGTSDVFVVAPMTGGVCFRAESVSPTSAVNTAPVTVVVTGWALDAARQEVRFGTELAVCTDVVGGLSCDVAANALVGPVDITITQVKNYADDGSGNAVLVDLDPADQRTFVLADGFTFN